MFDLDYLTNSMNYEPDLSENQAKKSAGPKEANHNVELEKLKRQEKEANDAARKEATHETQDVNTNNINLLNAVSTPVSVVGPSRALNDAEPSYPDDPSVPHLEDIYASPNTRIFTNSSYDEEVYVTQPPRFVDPKFPNKVYKVVKALHGLCQDPRAWYATLSTFLERSGYRRGAIDNTLFIKQDKKDIMLVQVYMDDIIFGSTKKSCVKTASTPIETQKPLVKDEEADDVDVHLYRSMIGSLMYLTASRPD
nr:Gag-Pol polyprotein [Tanacetum cinerariifolium]